MLWGFVPSIKVPLTSDVLFYWFLLGYPCRYIGAISFELSAVSLNQQGALSLEQFTQGSSKNIKIRLALQRAQNVSGPSLQQCEGMSIRTEGHFFWQSLPAHSWSNSSSDCHNCTCSFQFCSKLKSFPLMSAWQLVHHALQQSLRVCPTIRVLPLCVRRMPICLASLRTICKGKSVVMADTAFSLSLNHH